MKAGLKIPSLRRQYLTAFAGVVFLLWTAFGSAQKGTTGAHVRELNGQLLQTLAQLQSSSNAAGNGIRGQARLLIEQRSAELASLIEKNPEEALRMALPSDVLSDLQSAFPESSSQLESHGSWEGPIEYIVEDGPDFKSHRNIRTMKVNGETLFIQFAGSDPMGLKNGDVLRVEGIRDGNQVAADSGTIQQSKGAPPQKGLICSTAGPQKVIILRVTMPGSPLPSYVTQTSVLDAFFHVPSSGSDPLLSLTDYWRENSFGMTTALGDLANGPDSGWYTLDQIYDSTQLSQLRTAAIRAADADVNFTQYTRLFLIVNGPDFTTGGGWGTIGCGTLSSADGTFNASTSWIRELSFTDNLRAAHSLIHEGGHNLGLQHANSRDFALEALGSPGLAGVIDEYGDSFSSMGRSFGHYAAPHKTQIGWLTSQVQTITTSGTYTIEPAETPGAVQALKIRRGTDNANWLWLEYRQPIGAYDSKLSAPFLYGLPPNQIAYLDSSVSRVYSGAVVHYADAATGIYAHLLDFTPQSLNTNTSTLVADDWLDPPLFGTWSDPFSGLSITTSNPTYGSLTVTVVYGPQPCVASNPTVTISPSNPSAKRGQNVTFTVSVTNNDTGTCAGRSFLMSSSLPGGWSTSFLPASLTIAPETTGVVSMSKAVPANAATGTLAVDATATSGTSSGTGTASVTVKPGN